MTTLFIIYQITVIFFAYHFLDFKNGEMKEWFKANEYSFTVNYMVYLVMCIMWPYCVYIAMKDEH